MNNENRPDYPVPDPYVSEGAGLTKLEAFTMAAMQGVYSNEPLLHKISEETLGEGLGNESFYIEVSKIAINQAKETLKLLEGESNEL